MLNAQQTLLGFSRMHEFGFEDGGPVLASSLVLLQLSDVGQLTGSHPQAFHLGIHQEDLRADQGEGVPLDGIA